MNKFFIKNGLIKPITDIVIKQNGRMVINPTKEMLIADGWEEYIIPEKVITLDEIKMQKIEEIIAYDSSDDVNRFYVAGFPIWLDKLTRVGLQGRLNAERVKGKINTTLWYEHMQFTLPIDMAEQMLYEVEMYASACYDNTQSHIAAVMELDNTLAVQQYDYTIGYPEKLMFDL